MKNKLTTEAPPSSSVQAPVEAKAPESPFSRLMFTRADLAAWRKSQPALFPPDATPHREPPPAEALHPDDARECDPIGGPTYDALWVERDALKADGPLGTLGAYFATKTHDAAVMVAWPPKTPHREPPPAEALHPDDARECDPIGGPTYDALWVERDALKAEVERLSAITNTLTKMPTYGDFADVHANQMWISRELLASVTRMAARLGEQVKKFTAERDAARADVRGLREALRTMYLNASASVGEAGT